MLTKISVINKYILFVSYSYPKSVRRLVCLFYIYLWTHRNIERPRIILFYQRVYPLLPPKIPSSLLSSYATIYLSISTLLKILLFAFIFTSVLHFPVVFIFLSLFRLFSPFFLIYLPRMTPADIPPFLPKGVPWFLYIHTCLYVGILNRRLIHLIPTDAEVCESLESVSHINSRAADASPKMSPR